MSATATTSREIPNQQSSSPFNKLPPELKVRIVELVDQQDATYRDLRIENAGEYDPTQLDPPELDSLSSKWHGKGINQLALCNLELGELASACLYSDLNDKLAESTSFLYNILSRYRHNFKSVTIIDRIYYLDRSRASRKSSPLMLALPHLPNVTSIIIEEYPRWMPGFTQAYGESLFSSIASQIRHLEINVWANDPGFSVEDNYILRDRDFIIQLQTPLSQISSLNINCEIISIKTLEAINSLNQLKYLKVVALNTSLDGTLPGAVLWTQGTSLISASITAYKGWDSTLFRWIQAFGLQLENLEISGHDFPAVDPAVESPAFPSLLHLTIGSGSYRSNFWMQILPYFQASPLAHLTFGDTFHIWVSGRKSPIAKEFLRGDIFLMLKEVGKVFAKKYTHHQHREAQVLVRGMCERCNLRYQYKASLLAPPSIRPSDLTAQDREEWE